MTHKEDSRRGPTNSREPGAEMHSSDSLEQALWSEARNILPSDELAHRIVSSVRSAAARDHQPTPSRPVQATRAPLSRSERPRALRTPALVALAAALLVTSALSAILWTEAAVPESATLDLTHRPIQELDFGSAAYPSTSEFALALSTTTRLTNPFRRFFRAEERRLDLAEELIGTSTFGRDPLLAEAENLLSDASRVAEGLTRLLPDSLKGLGLPN